MDEITLGKLINELLEEASELEELRRKIIATAIKLAEISTEEEK